MKNNFTFFTTFSAYMLFILNKKILGHRQSAPKAVGAYQLIKELKTNDKQRTYGVGIYQKKQSQVFIKTWNDWIKDSAYYSLQNEFLISNLLLDQIKKTGVKGIAIPRPIEIIQKDRSLSLAYERIDGIPLSQLTNTEQKKVIDKIHIFFEKLSETNIHTSFRKRNAYWFILCTFFLYPIYLVRNPFRIASITREFANIISELYKLRHTNLCFAHGDLEPNNVLMRKKEIIICDCESVTVTLPHYDEAFLSILSQHKHLSMMPKSKSFLVLRKYLRLFHTLFSDVPLQKNHSIAPELI